MRKTLTLILFIKIKPPYDRLRLLILIECLKPLFSFNFASIFFCFLVSVLFVVQKIYKQQSYHKPFSPQVGDYRCESLSFSSTRKLPSSNFFSHKFPFGKRLPPFVLGSVLII